MGLFDWIGEFALGIDVMDREHEAILQAARDLETAVIQSRGAETTLKLLDATIATCGAHMSGEEALFRRAHFPGLPLHKHEHDSLLSTLHVFRAKVAEGAATVDLSVLEFLAGWLASHVRTEDRRAAAFLKQLAKAS